MSDTYKQIAPIIGKGCKEFAQVTRHGGRACLVTYSLGNGVTAMAVMQQTRYMNESGLQSYKRVDPYTDAVFQDVLDGVFLKDGKAKMKSGSKLKGGKKECGRTYQDKKPAALKDVEDEGADATAKGGEGRKEDADLVCNPNSTSNYVDVVKQLQQDLADLKKKMIDREAIAEAPSPPKRAKREEGGVGVGNDGDGSNAGGNGVARGTGNPDAMFVDRMVRENDEMRRMIYGMQYGNGNALQGASGGRAPMVQYPRGTHHFRVQTRMRWSSMLVLCRHTASHSSSTVTYQMIRAIPCRNSTGERTLKGLMYPIRLKEGQKEMGVEKLVRCCQPSVSPVL